MAKSKRKTKKVGLSLPKAVTIGPHKVPVTWGKGITARHEADGEVWGAFTETNLGGVIFLDSSMRKTRLLATFLHEICHAIDETYGLKLKHRQVYGLGEGLAQALGPWLRDKKHLT